MTWPCVPGGWARSDLNTLPTWPCCTLGHGGSQNSAHTRLLVGLTGAGVLPGLIRSCPDTQLPCEAAGQSGDTHFALTGGQTCPGHVDQGAGLGFSHHTGATTPRPRPSPSETSGGLPVPVTDQAASVQGAGTYPSHPAMPEPGLWFRCPASPTDTGGQARLMAWGTVKKGGVERWEGCLVGTRGQPWDGTAASWARKVGEGAGRREVDPHPPSPVPQPAGRVYSPPPPPSRELLAARDRETKVSVGRG